MPEQQFGEIQGYPEGSVFNSRMQIKNAGLHKYHIAGISRVLNVGCDCIVLNGGYVDDRDYGDEILYTGEGGRWKHVSEDGEIQQHGNYVAVWCLNDGRWQIHRDVILSS